LIIFDNQAQNVDVIKYVEQNEIDSVYHFIQEGNDINGIYPRYSLLELAIRYNQIDIVKLLLNHHVDVNRQNNRTSPLYISVIYGDYYQSNDILSLLVNQEADINFKGLNGLTPFVLACKISNAPAAKLLYEKGADYSIDDQRGNDFFYYVLRGSDLELIQYFVSKGFEIPRMSSIQDGPYLMWENDKVLDINYMRYDSLSDHAEWTSTKVDLDEDDPPPFLETINLKEEEKKNPENVEWEFKNVKEIFVVSDIHGHFKNLVEILKNTKVIDDELNWSWGKGHLVICGDVFDRGDQVTECLWLIYKLEKQAEIAGGKVHYILGNHELMLLKDNDKSYTNDKYILPFAKSGLDYHDLFENNYELGRWIRTKNVVEKINNLLFVHGGIPPEFVGIGQTIENMNQLIHIYLSENSDSIQLLNNIAIQPTWYRGYFDNIDHSAEIKNVLDYYDVKNIIVGHTPINKVKFIQDGTVIGVGVHFGEPGVPAEGLMIRNKDFYRVDENGHEEKL
jgi:hypothetical protein